MYFSFRCGSKIAERNGERRRRITQPTYLDKTREEQLFQASMDFTKAQAPFAMKAPRHRRRFFPTTAQTTGVRELQAWATAHYSKEVTVLGITHSARYLHPALYHRKYQELWVPFHPQSRAITARYHTRPVLPAFRVFLAVIRQLMATKNRARCF